MRLRAFTLLAGFFFSWPGAARAGEPFPWKPRLTDGSSRSLAALHEQICAGHAGALTAHTVTNLVWSEEDFELKIESGTLYTEPPVQGVVVGAFFEGRATVTFKPPSQTARTGLKMQLGRESLENVPIGNAYIYSVRPDSPLSKLAGETAAGSAAALRSTEVYAADKSAMRQLGLDLLALLLDRSGPASGATFVLFPMEEIRGPRSEEARILYSFDPGRPQAVELSVFGHEEMVSQKPYKFRFYQLVSYPSRRQHPAVSDVSKYTVRISLGTSANSAVQEATLALRPGPGTRALHLGLTCRMEVSSVTDQDGRALPFLQWAHLLNDPDFDETVLVGLAGEEGDEGADVTALTFKSSGLLFEPAGGSFYLVDEDNWYPHLALDQDADYELDLTIPKRLDGIGVGQKITSEEMGISQRIVYRTTQPTDSSTFYYGDYTKTEAMADEVSVELYQQRLDLRDQKNAKFALTEITNMLKVFNRLFVPLDIKSLRVASTFTQHGRGFEGLLLLGGGGTSDSSSSSSDLFRAHEVAHQWWGNYVRTKEWPRDRWLSESFAEYAAMEYYKARYEDHAKAVEVMRNNWLEPLTFGALEIESLTGDKQKVEGGTAYPLAAGTNNVYTKGPLVLHMLRYVFMVQKNKDDAFFPMLRDFLTTYRYRPAGTEDFRKIAEKHAGVDLGWFFDQWVEDGGLPVLKWSYALAEEGGGWTLNLKAEQSQKKYKLVVPIYIRFPGDKVAVRPWLIEGETAERSLKLPAKPSSVTLNDNLEALLILKNP